MTAGQIYRCDVQFVSGSNTFVVPVYIHCNAFTYLGDLSSNRDKVRFYIGDTDPGGGPLPSDKNFSDPEIDGLVTAEGNWQKAVAAGFETLAAAWLRYPSFDDGALKLNRSDIAKGYQAQARVWRRKYGSSGTVMGSRQITRVDAYSDDKDNVED